MRDKRGKRVLVTIFPEILAMVLRRKEREKRASLLNLLPMFSTSRRHVCLRSILLTPFFKLP
jgi:hypothetical protein